MLKQKIYAECLALLNQKIAECKSEITALVAGIENDVKSSTGDKHETARAMMQLEQQKHQLLLDDLNIRKETLHKINIDLKSVGIVAGSLIKTNRGFLFLSVAIGKVDIDGIPVMVLSQQSPLGHLLTGLKAGESAEINGVKYSIEEVT